MSENFRVWIEVIFNVSYLIVVWVLVGSMAFRLKRGEVQERSVAKRMMWAFALLALGDTGHVGFRVIAYTRGGLEANPLLVGAGAMSTAFTVTAFYMLMVVVWRLHFQKKIGWFGWFLLAAGFVRLIVMLFPQNDWGRIVPPYGWSLLRNIFLVIQGIGVMILILRDAVRTKDRAFTWIGIMIALSFIFYAPVILWVNKLPILGMLMIPKTCAYLGIAFIALKAIFQKTNINRVDSN